MADPISIFMIAGVIAGSIAGSGGIWWAIKSTSKRADEYAAKIETQLEKLSKKIEDGLRDRVVEATCRRTHDELVAFVNKTMEKVVSDIAAETEKLNTNYFTKDTCAAMHKGMDLLVSNIENEIIELRKEGSKAQREQLTQINKMIELLKR